MGFTDTKESELLSFLSFFFAFPDNLLCLIDTYDDLKSGLPNAILVSTFAYQYGATKFGVRLDSGNLIQLSLDGR